ncbi:hypothetical protein PSAC2689_10508 [Paraburkholderia sacchari]
MQPSGTVGATPGAAIILDAGDSCTFFVHKMVRYFFDHTRRVRKDFLLRVELDINIDKPFTWWLDGTVDKLDVHRPASACRWHRGDRIALFAEANGSVSHKRRLRFVVGTGQVTGTFEK